MEATANFAFLETLFPRHEPIVPLTLHLEALLFFLPPQGVLLAPLPFLFTSPLLQLLLLHFPSNSARPLCVGHPLQVEQFLFPLELFPSPRLFLLLEDRE
jgi:hypothetical protein